MTLVSLGCVVVVALADTRAVDDALGPFATEVPQAVKDSIAPITQATSLTQIQNAAMWTKLRGWSLRRRLRYPGCQLVGARALQQE